MPKRIVRVAGLALIGVAAVGWGEVAGLAQTSKPPTDIPVFEVDTAWPKLPNDWVLGVVSAVTVDRHDHVWILHRPRSVQEALKKRAAPPVLEFDANGRFVNAWGGLA